MPGDVMLTSEKVRNQYSKQVQDTQAAMINMYTRS